MNDIRESLKALDVRPQKLRGQNFLVDGAAVHALLEFAQPVTGTPMIEIGPGLGALTQHLFHFGPLTVIEVEPQFCVELKKRFPSIAVVQSDVRQVGEEVFTEGVHVYGNLPYSLSTEIIFHLLRFSHRIRRALIMLQREFVARMGAAPGSRTYGALSVALQRKAQVRLGPEIAGDSFFPETKVWSQVVELVFTPRAPSDIWEDLWVERVVRAAFSERRRKIINSLVSSNILTNDEARLALSAAEIDPQVRAETLSVAQYERLTRHVRELCEARDVG